ncbi:sulfatase-like hydrolase/transferase [Paenibacillus allorhizosphaerae]|uniref:Sulfatase N-terminal domain-containing protein n=1 Tax=Paenibacillus allorhizosphaerae TaxID=2849866 RepID=A0ABM8VHX4_9BACL|nr:sulfatase-like hydrolase/transferase [Paenibacillus allorhizosphaerae]CAG7642947.1 hypothetical protein PAECIP111802_02926 [Paenibacillus allorhizosphaerae]
MPQLIRLMLTAILTMVLLTIQSSEFELLMNEPTLPVIVPKPPTWTEEELNKRQPNIIVVLSESFWDITRLPGLKFSRDPAPFFHSLQEQYTHGTMLSPQFGGGTANVEFEVLTGHSMRFFREWAIVYDKYIHQPTASLSSILASQGYRTTAISPVEHWYANSSQVYKYLGFSRFISQEYFNPDDYVGPYLGDHSVARRIIEESQRNEGPDFIYADTMENHYHYWPGKFKRNTITVQGNVSDTTIGIAETYAQGMSGADRMLQELVTYYNQSKEPTIIVFFGDHLPSLEQYFVYEDTKYITGEDDPEFLEKMYHVPVLVWNNYLPPEAKDELHISPSFLSPYILHTAQLKGSDYTDYLYQLSQKMPIIPPEDHYEAMQIDKRLVDEYEARQTHIMEAERTAPPPPESEYILGYGDPRIDKISPDTVPVPVRGGAFGKTLLNISGGRFGQGSTAFINGKPYETQWQSEGTLVVSLPKESIAAPGSLDIQVKVLDSNKKVLGQSRIVKVPVTDKPPGS